MEILAKYENGNYNVKIYEDGTKIRYNSLNNFTPDFSESIDCTITTKCNGSCNFCYLNCDENGKHADLNNKILDSLHSGTELAININDVSHPQLEDFLIRMKDKGIIINVTINQKHLNKNIDKLKDWQDNKFIWGIGVSLSDSSDKQLIENISSLKNAVIHVIDGCFTKEDLENLSNHNIKLLILGYKIKGRGIEYYSKNKEQINNNIEFLKLHLYDYKKYFNGFSFDNLATEHLEIRKLVGEEKWNLYHMGDEGEFTFFIDLVNKTYATSSLETENIFNIKEHDTTDSMFKHIRYIFMKNKGEVMLR